MCGIAGILGLGGQPVALDELRAMSGDARPSRPGRRRVLPRRRASGSPCGGCRIIDLATGQQPMRNEDGTVWVVFNGEIYNYRELRRELAGPRPPLRTTTDTEVIVHLYEELGPDCVDKLRGMFAFALWDARRGSSCSPATGSASSRSTTREVGGRLCLRLRAEGAPGAARRRARGSTGPRSAICLTSWRRRRAEHRRGRAQARARPSPDRAAGPRPARRAVLGRASSTPTAGRAEAQLVERLRGARSTSRCACTW